MWFFSQLYLHTMQAIYKIFEILKFETKHGLIMPWILTSKKMNSRQKCFSVVVDQIQAF